MLILANAHKNFEVGDWVLAYSSKQTRAKKLQIWRIGPFQISKILNDNAYQLALPPDWRISSTFNTTYVYIGGPTTPPITVRGIILAATTDATLPILHSMQAPSPRGPVKQFLIEWRGKPELDLLNFGSNTPIIGPNPFGEVSDSFFTSENLSRDIITV